MNKEARASMLVPPGLDPVYWAMSLMRQRRFQPCIDVCTELLSQNPRDLAVWSLKARALTSLHYIDDTELEEEGIGDVMLDENATASVPRPGTSFSAPRSVMLRRRSMAAAARRWHAARPWGRRMCDAASRLLPWSAASSSPSASGKGSLSPAGSTSTTTPSSVTCTTAASSPAGPLPAPSHRSTRKGLYTRGSADAATAHTAATDSRDRIAVSGA